MKNVHLDVKYVIDRDNAVNVSKEWYWYLENVLTAAAKDFMKRGNNVFLAHHTVSIAQKQNVLAARNMILERFALKTVTKTPKATKHVINSAENALVALNLNVSNVPRVMRKIKEYVYLFHWNSYELNDIEYLNKFNYFTCGNLKKLNHHIMYLLIQTLEKSYKNKTWWNNSS